ncbi:MAG: nitroreductase [Fibrobacter sp.]|jgi:nitroreductase|nr:nitroreductase [Fibrobacter sp.]
MDFLELVRKRHSVRDFLDKPVDQTVLLSVLEAGRLAPSACNFQPWVFIVIQKMEGREKLRTVNDRPWFLSAPVILAVCCDRSVSWKRKDGKDFGDIDIAIALDHITLAAAEKDLGTCWIGSFNASEARKVLRLPTYIEPVAFTPIGYPASSSFNKVRKSLPEILHWEYFGGK